MLRKEDELIRMIKEALAAEKMAARDYEIMIEAARSPEDARWLAHIRNDEKRHYLILEDIYRDLTGKDYPLSRSPASMPAYFREMVKTSICDELEAAAFYEKLAARFSCSRHREAVHTILNDEKEHARTLAGIYKNFDEETPEHRGIY